MNYNFPEIRTIDDVLPHIKDHPEFIVAEREFGTVINYMVSMPDTFGTPHIGVKMVPGAKPYFAYDYGDLVRRECRGLIFDLYGNIMSRPFHKFFNVNEREETQTHLIDMSRPHVIMEKMDGSMIRPVRLNGMVRLATKMGVTEIAEEAEKLLSEDQYDWLDQVMMCNVTPIFEYIAPTNKIVIDYAEPKLVLLAMRNNFTGNYYMPDQAPFEVVPMYGSVDGGLAEYIARAREMQGREGDIIRFADGHMLKIKNDWYVRIHKTKDLIRTERNIADIIVNNELDDLLPLLDENDLVIVRDYEAKFSVAFQNIIGRIEGLLMIAKTVYGGDRKRVALEMVPNLIHAEDAAFVFSGLGGKDIRELVLKKVQTAVGNTTRYDQLKTWMEFPE